MSSLVEKLAIEHGSTCYTGQQYHFDKWQLEAFAKALQQSSEPVADYTPNKDCTMCNGGGLYCVGYSGSESDGNAPILERCECYLDNITPPASVPLEKYNKLLDAFKSARNTLEFANELGGPISDTIWHGEAQTLFDFMDSTIAEAEGEEG